MATQRHDNALLSAQKFSKDLPVICWLNVRDIKIDTAYQHRVHLKQIETFLKGYHLDRAGFILVNQRADGSLYAIDGQTRLETQRLLLGRGNAAAYLIKAEMLFGLSQMEEADWYLTKCVNFQRIPLDWYMAEVTAGHPEAVRLHALLESRHIEVNAFSDKARLREGYKGSLRCIHTLKKCMRIDATAMTLQMTLDLLIETWGYGERILSMRPIDALHGLLLRYADQIEAKRFREVLGATSLEQLSSDAQSLKLVSPGLTLRAALQTKIVETYNRHLQGSRRILLGSA